MKLFGNYSWLLKVKGKIFSFSEIEGCELHMILFYRRPTLLHVYYDVNQPLRPPAGAGRVRRGSGGAARMRARAERYLPARARVLSAELLADAGSMHRRWQKKTSK